MSSLNFKKFEVNCLTISISAGCTNRDLKCESNLCKMHKNLVLHRGEVPKRRAFVSVVIGGAPAVA